MATSLNVSCAFCLKDEWDWVLNAGKYSYFCAHCGASLPTGPLATAAANTANAIGAPATSPAGSNGTTPNAGIGSYTYNLGGVLQGASFTYAGVPVSGLSAPFFSYIPPKEEPKKETPPRETCWTCGRELCKELDAYWGIDPMKGHTCTPCRLGRQC